MVFSSLTFLYIFLPVVMAVYYLTPKRWKNAVLLAEGILFYAWGEPVYIIVVMASTLMDYFYGLLMARYRENARIMKSLLVLSVVSNVGILAVFKYGSFLIRTLDAVFHLGIPDPHIPLPVGVSFHTFQSMSYTIDLYLGNIAVQRSALNFCTYVTLFPQMVAGPIVRYSEVEHEIGKRTVNLDTLTAGIRLFIIGLCKKVLLANNIGSVWSTIKALPAEKLTVAGAWFGILCFTFQIYFDFSGYSDMAIGLGKMLGFSFPQNFRYPYLAKSVSEFWRRWHITLGMWFRNFVYIPLGGNRCSKPRMVFNLLVVWSLTGLWHGASWNFVLWGSYFGILIIAEKLFLRKYLERMPAGLQVFYAFTLVVLGWVLFEFEKLPAAFGFYGALFGARCAGFIDSQTLYWILSNALLFILCALFSTDLTSRLLVRLRAKRGVILDRLSPIVQTAGLLTSTVFLVDASYNPFLYFRF